MNERADANLIGELRELIDQLLDSQLSPTQCQRLEALVTSSEACADHYVRMMQLNAGLARTAMPPLQLGQLQQEGAAELQAEVAVLSAQVEALTEIALVNPPAHADSTPAPTRGKHPSLPAPIVSSPDDPSLASFWSHLPKSFFAFALGLLLLGGIGGWLLSRAWQNPVVDRHAPIIAAGKDSDGQPYTAKLVNLTNCRWDTTRSTADLHRGGGLMPGQSLFLLEGVAEIDCKLPSGSSGQFQIEGPSALMLSSEGMPSLQFGKLAAVVVCNYECFTLDTPMGRVMVPSDASLGIIATTNGAEVHVFTGQAAIETSWLLGGEEDERLKVTAGESIRLSTTAGGGISIDRAEAEYKRFVTQLSMTASQLHISPKYVAAIRAAQPIAYWRFEDDADGLVRNEMGDRWHCRINGSLSWRNYKDNRSAEFGSSTDAGYLISDDQLDGVIRDSYTCEMWIKPSHYHHAALLSLLEWAPGDPIGSHGMLVEMCGPISGQASISRPDAAHPGRIRFLHRFPAGVRGGTSCFSREAYALRKWQLLTCVKDGSAMRLYIDGNLTAEINDANELPQHLRVLIGQLHPYSAVRPAPVSPFVGEMDEVAIYDRALTEAEIESHYQLVQNNSHGS